MYNSARRQLKFHQMCTIVHVGERTRRPINELTMNLDHEILMSTRGNVLFSQSCNIVYFQWRIFARLRDIFWIVIVYFSMRLNNLK